MPILQKDFSTQDTTSTLYITVPLRSVPPSKVDVYCSDVYLKINFCPFFFEIDLFDKIDVANSTTKLGNGVATCELKKATPGQWPNVKYQGNPDEIKQRRKDSEQREFKRIQELKEASLTQKREAERELVRKQIEVEREKRTRVEELKKKERDETGFGIKEWALKTLNNERAKRQDSGVFEPNQTTNIQQIEYTNQTESMQQIEYKNTDDLDQEDEFEDDEDIDIEAIRQNVRKQLYGNIKEVPPPRNAGNVEILFTSRDDIPTTTARETEDAKWRLRIKLAKQMQKQKLDSFKLDQLEKLVEKANNFFGNMNFESAVNAYSEALELDNQNVKCLANRAASWLKMENYHACIQDCNNALKVIETEQEILSKEFKKDDGMESERKKFKIKLYCRRGAAHYNLKQDNQAIQDYELALALDPENQQIQRNLLDIKS